MLLLPAGRCGAAGMGKMLTSWLWSPGAVYGLAWLLPNHPISADSQWAVLSYGRLWADQQQFIPVEFEEF